MLLRVEVLAFEDCPNRDVALKRVRAVLDEEHLTAEVIAVEVASQALAEAVCFLGSPSVRINGVDIELVARSEEHFGLMCRTYMTAQGAEGAPPIEMIRAALRSQSERRSPRSDAKHHAVTIGRVGGDRSHEIDQLPGFERVIARIAPDGSAAWE